MPKDYGQKGGGGGRQTAGKKGLPGWVWLFVGIAIGALGFAAYSITRPRADVVATADAGKDKNGKEKKKITIPPKEPSRFAFYELLPKYEVLIPKETLKPKAAPAQPTQQPAQTANEETPKPAETQQADRFVIQVGAFKDRKEADGQRANLAMLGVESRIEEVTIDKSTTFYRVRIGPERDQRKVESILTRLEENNIQANVMRVEN